MTDSSPTLQKPPKPGDTRWAWCRIHMDRTTHLWDGHQWICLECFPELESDRDADDDPLKGKHDI